MKNLVELLLSRHTARKGRVQRKLAEVGDVPRNMDKTPEGTLLHELIGKNVRNINEDTPAGLQETSEVSDEGGWVTDMFKNVVQGNKVEILTEQVPQVVKIALDQLNPEPIFSCFHTSLIVLNSSSLPSSLRCYSHPCTDSSTYVQETSRLLKQRRDVVSKQVRVKFLHVFNEIFIQHISVEFISSIQKREQFKARNWVCEPMQAFYIAALPHAEVGGIDEFSRHSSCVLAGTDRAAHFFHGWKEPLGSAYN